MNSIYTKFLFFIGAFLLYVYSIAQPAKNKCSTGDLLNKVMETESYISVQRQIKEATKNIDFIKSDTVITIPVIVHVIYKNATEKIYDDQVYSQIEVLNDDFRRLNSDLSQVPSEFSKADIKIEFCLANQKPDGSYSTGIINVPTTLDDVGYNNTYYTISPTWGDEYLNIWVCDFGRNIAGRGTPPGTVPVNRDGVIIDYTNFGTIGTVQSPYHLGRTVTHEVGHWLNLFHTWGQNDQNPNCNSDDLVSDTPDQSEIYFNCPIVETSCGSRDMTTNFMGYVNDACMANFTNGQKTRMRSALLSARSSIVNSTKGCRSVGIRENSNTTQFSIFPNPSNGNLSILTYTRNGLYGSQIEIINQFGQEVYTKKVISTESIQLNISKYPSGIYFVKIEKDNFFTIKKLILNN